MKKAISSAAPTTRRPKPSERNREAWPALIAPSRLAARSASVKFRKPSIDLSSKATEGIALGDAFPTHKKSRWVAMRTLIALSGGPDSTALLLTLHDSGQDVVAAHYDHALQDG